jgi:hypothetical protein
MIVFKKTIDHSTGGIYPDIEISLSDDAGMEDLLMAFKSFALACGYHPDTVREYLESD